ncbi:hypothetical protein PORUE0001_1973 [Porphyromonas uenonis 60-3]|uniref:Uncharacterized protein n=2 Tax=Porphyromonas uenonis TaxID=281920 RepID=C2MDF7_9PORP|nr:hypothetical protein PORUE0001_1973 [Porphyromonas uenonis 60-3]
MSKTNKNKDVDPDTQNSSGKRSPQSSPLPAESKALVNKTLLEVVLNRYHIDLKKKTDL